MPAVVSPDEGGFEGEHLAELMNFLAPGVIGADALSLIRISTRMENMLFIRSKLFLKDLGTWA